MKDHDRKTGRQKNTQLGDMHGDGVHFDKDIMSSKKEKGAKKKDSSES
ncbi:MAG: hypothetical protein VX712_01610 [Bacteroidota bacterium]|nr:hypothetical protein [Bacteroidota bacterium]|tara:strand:+ start:184 stop:327 length:144 start_codon:yes stop_codon:yes gene_type:complete